MKKLSKKAWRAKCKKVFDLIIHRRDAGRCRRCGSSTRQLNVSHIFPKGTFRSMEFVALNAKLLCSRPCHLDFWHSNPVEAAKWIERELGNEYWDLVDMSNQNFKVDEVFYHETLERLNKELANV